ncbi:MAG TPA: 16S rRNA (uracil(1498)-N(3))-methyltransferase [Methylovirgula sp.]|nr:16S rRNA (uracil(1498)-N(3))-methyltransferase [Methylovirgula sp.]
MARNDFTPRRLYVEAQLSTGGRVELNAAQAHYLRNVLRLSDGAEIPVFNGRDGEWRARLSASSRHPELIALAQIRPQEPGADLHYLFAPLKHARQDYMVQKAVEMGASLLQPVLTRHTQAERVNLERMRANAIEAAEQCGLLTVPEIAAPRKLDLILAGWPEERLLVFCDEAMDGGNPVAELQKVKAEPRPLALLIGPEGGFDAAERAAILAGPCVLRLSLGPRILRADTAAVAALALVQAILGDWR